MEQRVLLRKKVYDRLNKGFVEARIHMDGLARIGKKKDDANHVLQKKYAKSVALPTYVVIDPKTRKPLGTMRGYKDVETFLAFLSKAKSQLAGKPTSEKVGSTR